MHGWIETCGQVPWGREGWCARRVHRRSVGWHKGRRCLSSPMNSTQASHDGDWAADMFG